MDTVIRVDCEWDCGQEYYVFQTMGEALLWCEKNPYIEDIDEARKDGFLTFTELEIWRP